MDCSTSSPLITATEPKALFLNESYVGEVHVRFLHYMYGSYIGEVHVRFLRCAGVWEGTREGFYKPADVNVWCGRPGCGRPVLAQTRNDTHTPEGNADNL